MTKRPNHLIATARELLVLEQNGDLAARDELDRRARKMTTDQRVALDNLATEVAEAGREAMNP